MPIAAVTGMTVRFACDVWPVFCIKVNAAICTATTKKHCALWNSTRLLMNSSLRSSRRWRCSLCKPLFSDLFFMNSR
jgi:hypothetical protein